jgi:hypothetical protein
MKKGHKITLWIILIISVLGLFFANTIHNAVVLDNKNVKTYDNFCGRSSYAYCTDNEQCIPSGCGEQLCGAWTEAREPPETCKTKDCYNAKKYNLECVCYKSLCQWKNKTIFE